MFLRINVFGSLLCKKKHKIDVQKFVLNLKMSAVVHIPPAFTFTLNQFGRVGATKFCRANAPKKTFVWFQTAFAWKVKLLSNTFAWIQNSFFGSLICRKKQLTRILDDSWKSIVLGPQFFCVKMQEISSKLVWRN